MNGVSAKRVPIVVSEHAIALVTLFKLPHDHIEDMWALDWTREEGHNHHQRSARTMIDALEDYWSPKFLMALRREITRRLEDHDNDYGTEFANQTKENT